MLDVLHQVIERASVDAAFRGRLASDPVSALRGYDLTLDERATVLSDAIGSTVSLGLDARVSKIDNPAMPGDAFPNGPFDHPFGS